MIRFLSQRPDRSQNTQVGGGGYAQHDPDWSVVLAIIVFGAVQYLFHGVLPHHRAELLPMRLLMGIHGGRRSPAMSFWLGMLAGCATAQDARAGLWMLIVVVMPGGIGAVVYFLLRQPMVTPCPHCSTELTSSVHFCPQCQFQLAPVCGRCFRGVQITDVYCTQCGHDLAEDNAPARLRVYSD